MKHTFLEDYFKKVFLLELYCGTKTSYEILEPFHVNTNIISIQDAAKRIAEFIKLSGFTFIVAVCKQKEHIGGHIELNRYEPEVFVEISENVIKSETATLAALAHEITHKYLHFYDIYSKTGTQNEHENEILTDIAAVFLGLGKLMLNGCENQNIHIEYSSDQIKETTETLTTGYLNLHQLAFVYRLVCAMRKIDPIVYERNLSDKSIIALKDCESYYGNYFDNRYHKDETRKELTDPLQIKIREIQSTLSGIDKLLFYVRNLSAATIDSFLDEIHQKLYKLQVESNKVLNDSHYDPSLKYLNSIKISQRIKNIISELTNVSYEANQNQQYLAKLAIFINNLRHQFQKPNPPVFVNVKCRNCGTELNLPESKHTLIVNCPNPKCKYRFLASTSLSPVFEEPKKIIEESRFKRVLKKLFYKR